MHEINVCMIGVAFNANVCTISRDVKTMCQAKKTGTERSEVGFLLQKNSDLTKKHRI